ncbi:MAG: type II secretion system F family protein [Alphaproteobacteria bacterium]|nr:type II secretion system F family protein [Alphaproteobacteria bacterium]
MNNFDSLVAQIVDPAFLAAVFAAVATFATVLTIAAPAFGNSKLEARLKGVSNRREELRRKSRAALATEKKTIRKRDTSMVKKFVDLLDLQKMLADPNVAKKLVQAGLRGPKPVSMFYFFRFSTPLVLGIGAFAYLWFVNDHNLEIQKKIGAVVFAFAAGFYGPNLYLENLITKRKGSIMRAFPDSLDMMLICVESGMSIEMAFARVGEEIGTASAELAEELALTTAELSYLADRRMAYYNLAERTNHPGVKGVATALVQAEKYGTPMGNALRTMAKENREMRITEAEKKAASLPAKLTVPMIVFFLPVLFLVILGPAFIKIKAMES